MLGRIGQSLNRHGGRRALTCSYKCCRAVSNTNKVNGEWSRVVLSSISHNFYSYSYLARKHKYGEEARRCNKSLGFNSDFVREFSQAAVAQVDTDTGADTNSEDSNSKPRKGARKLRKRKDPIVLTDSAVDRIKVLLSKRPDAVGVRLGVRTRGCNGLSYTLNYAEKDGEKKFETRIDSKGVSVFIEPKALMYMLGTTMDFYEDDLTAEFRFENPNADSYCGCGESFNVKKD
mmetsp:Transcript_7250/g.9459  ORF Transcript_7250/g.9459 Transcript_7250/m.9459 type:complete len:232 (+) Transcript_7250:179-874(+)